MILSLGGLPSCHWEAYYPVTGWATILSLEGLRSCHWKGYDPVMYTNISLLLLCVFLCLYPLKVQAGCPRHTPKLSGLFI